MQHLKEKFKLDRIAETRSLAHSGVDVPAIGFRNDFFGFGMSDVRLEIYGPTSFGMLHVFDVRGRFTAFGLCGGRR